MNISVEFYKGVDSELLSTPPKLQAKLIRILELMQTHGTDLGLNYTKPMGNGLFEVRAKALEGIARGLFCYLRDKRIMILHIFMKKTQKTPKQHIQIARKRMKELKQ